MISIIGICLCVYFAYHLMAGQRSWLRLVSLDRQISQVQQDYQDRLAQREYLEQRVVMMRPGSISRDLLEEQARTTLGFIYPGEKTLIVPRAGT